MEMVGVEPTRPRCKRGALPPELHPRGMRTGELESRYAQRYTPHLQRGELTKCSASAIERGGRPDSNRNLEDHDLGCCRYTTTTMAPMPAPASADLPFASRAENAGAGSHHGREAAGFSATTGTTGLEPAVSRLTSDCSCR